MVLNGAIYTDEELIKLWMFSNHVGRLSDFCRPMRKPMNINIDMSTAKSRKYSGSNIPTEVRLSATLNEIRSFTLKKDPTHFYTIKNIISKHNIDKPEVIKQLELYRTLWNEYDIEAGHKESRKMNVIYIIDNDKIDTYSKLLYYFIYGKYIHNDKDLAVASVVDRLQQGKYYPKIRADLGICVVEMCNILRAFNKQFVKPILKQYAGTIRHLNWCAIHRKKVPGFSTIRNDDAS